MYYRLYTRISYILQKNCKSGIQRLTLVEQNDFLEGFDLFKAHTVLFW